MDEREEYLVNRIKKMAADLEQAEAATKQIGKLVDAILIRIAMDFGEEVPGGYGVKLKKFDVNQLVEDFVVRVERKDSEYTFRAFRREV